MMSSHRIPAIATLYRGHSTSTALEKEERIDKESNKRYRERDVQSKKWYLSHKFFYVLFSVTQSFLLGFSWSSDNIPVSEKKEHFQAKASVTDITI